MEVEMSQAWLDDDAEWFDIDLDLIGEVIDDMLAEFEAGDYI